MPARTADAAKSWTALFALLLVGIGAAALCLRPPPASPADAPGAAFSSARAWPDILAIAQRPHPSGSADNARVRLHLMRAGSRISACARR